MIALARAAHGARVAAAILRWLGACTAGFAALLALSVALAGFERRSSVETAATSASAYLDFDLAALRALADRSLAGEDGLGPIWARRPDWRITPPPSNSTRLAPLRDAWAAVASDRSRFRTAARVTADALPFLLGGLALALLATAFTGAWSKSRRLKLPLAIALALPLLPMLDPGAFYDRTRSFGAGLAAALFVAAFAAALPGAALHALFSASPAIAGRVTAGRLAAIEAVQWLVPAVPALATAALFVCAKADQDPSVPSTASGLGALARAALREPSASERLSSCALIAGALVLLWYLGHRFVVEVRAALGARKVAP